ncbi:MAG TPA: triple tyrosine motif-containing protein, partial [Puia sp.]|nr:triple tyrosine motif-containing protein [Puia sp.]
MELAAYYFFCMIICLNKGRFIHVLKRIFPVILFPVFLSAQKVHFQNYNVQQGLIQSQVIAITQDHFDNLWFCTLGGISRFDGRVFTNYSETDGLISNFANTILADHESNIWIGTIGGISRFNGAGFTSFRFSENPAANIVKSIQEDSAHRIWALAGGTLYRINKTDKPLHTVVSGLYEIVTAIQIDRQGYLWAAILSKGIYKLENDGWKLQFLIPETYAKGACQKIAFDTSNHDRVFLMMFGGIYEVEKGDFRSLVKNNNLGKFTNIYPDRSGKLWFTCSKGLFQYCDSGLTAFNSSNGYEGSGTEAIFEDHEDNLWFGTSGTGVFRYSFQPFLIYDQFSATNSLGIMPMLADNRLLYFGTEGGGLFQYDGKKINHITGPSDDPVDQNIIGIYKAGEGAIYVLTSSGIFSKYENGKFTRIRLGDLRGCINTVLPDGHDGFWVSSCLGFFNVSASGKTTRILNLFSSRMLPVSKDSILVTTDYGAFMVGMDFRYRKINDSLLNTSTYMSVASLGPLYLFATSNKGLIIYNSISGKRTQFTKRNGLNADFIYSVVSDHKNQIWLGTGRGINKIVMDTTTETMQVSSLSIAGDISSSECNQGAAMYDEDGNLWFGTVSGLFKYVPDSDNRQTYLPPVILQQVQVYSKDIAPGRYAGLLNEWYAIPKNLVLPHNENHLTFSFRCPSYLNSESILYQYQLEGMEKSYSALTPNHFVVYPALPPGHYTFKARAFLPGLGFSNKNVDFSFDIKAAFYQTIYFKFLLLVFIMGSILWIQWLRMRLRAKRLNQIEEVKREENIKVRQTASEDFHDEVGNSLTRIQVLTDVLNSKLGNGHEEEKRIIHMIKENVSGLYQGTRDILWALNPESDLIKEIGQRLQSLGIDVFQDTGICFSYENLLGESGNIKLPGNYNRNIMMIFKEAMSNSLKHAQATKVKLKIQKAENGEILIELADNGIGFNPLYIKKGHGFQNMQKRSNRIKSTLTPISIPGEGT